jgi:hypothetical protein
VRRTIWHGEPGMRALPDKRNLVRRWPDQPELLDTEKKIVGMPK